VVAKVLNRILLTRLLKAVDEKLREQQTGFRKDRALHVVVRVPDDVDELLRYSIVCH
jgi:hypothetical protein